MGKLIIEGNQVYELDEQCLKNKAEGKKKQSTDEVQTRGNGRMSPPMQTRRGGR